MANTLIADCNSSFAKPTSVTTPVCFIFRRKKIASNRPTTSRWYVDRDPKKWATGRNPALYRGMGGEWKLTTTERKRILLQNIFGVDIDAQAVETTKLSLLLKVLEGESEQTLATQLRFYHERALPDLGRNIKCGNSLIGQDLYQRRNY